MRTNFDDRKLRVVISPVIASRLCNLGYSIVKIKQKRDIGLDDYKCNVVFLFEETENFLKDFYKIMDESKENK